MAYTMVTRRLMQSPLAPSALPPTISVTASAGPASQQLAQTTASMLSTDDVMGLLQRRAVKASQGSTQAMADLAAADVALNGGAPGGGSAGHVATEAGFHMVSKG